uniref:NADH-ubiquinone oxidoreductase chain 5 n=1 Tax=Anomalurus derbianus TaxID=2022012 RepID=A0A343EVN8_9RODE|nr:NADH dehydrogenase subunit 5 [Anomalurus derbianus]ASM91424.1 NADH dehydrogenase subunit 5 [Anomalurus derbianus]
MNLFFSSILMTLILLFLPIVLIPTPIYKSITYPIYITSLIKLAFALSLIPMMIFLDSGQEIIISNWHWVSVQNTKLMLSFKLDYFSMVFIPVALFVTWSIMEYSLWYMNSDPNINRFFMYLLTFLITMLILVTANNLFQLFIGWEGVGIMSFLLIGWWYGRTDANTAAMQAILYNRIGDIGLVLSMAWFLTNLNAWELQQMFMLDEKTNTLPLLGLLLAATGKSAQFGLHPWLPSAMEGPTPVSALLHSSTMVVAGIFLLIRFHHLTTNNTIILNMMLCLGAITTLFTAICALTQNDIKKIVAFSTSSQLGLMMVTLGMNQPHLAFMHICTHAFFKAMLFLCSGSIIHNLNNEQDIRKMGGLAKSMPITTSSLITGSLALTGMPFLTGFYSKDLIIESINTSYTNAWALTITLIATSMTAAYSTRMIFFALLGQPHFLPLITINENSSPLTNPIKRLLMGSILAGYLITNNLNPTNIPQLTMPVYLKLTALVITLIGFYIATELAMFSFTLKSNRPSKLYNFSTTLGYYPSIMHRSQPQLNLNISQNVSSALIDSTWLEKLIPKNISMNHMYASTHTSNQTGLIKLYFLSFLTSLTLATIMII